MERERNREQEIDQAAKQANERHDWTIILSITIEWRGIALHFS